MAYGKVHIYTGDGKGKTSAAFGLGLRAAGHGAKVVCVQFLKTGETGEREAVERLQNVSFYRFESDHGFFWNMDEARKHQLKQEIQRAYAFCLEQIQSAECDLLILDEILGVLQNGLLSLDQVRTLLTQGNCRVEIVLTGRNAPKELMECADYVTEMKCVKHPYEDGCTARRGIEY